ncbi:MAG: hypothetical protein Q8N23_06540 [Archangium sp.]|nr:hypothetical protein [Archangium sp.]MDP3570707.1 hypothetical protein [Archangium sp.]
MRAEPPLRLITGQPFRPPGKPLRASDVPDDLLLRSASAPQRERLLVGLSLTLQEPGQEPLRPVLRRVATEANALGLQQTLELAARQRSLGFIVEALGLDWLLGHGKSLGVKVNDVLATTDTVTERGLTSSEAKRIVENFGGTLDPGSVRFRFTTGVQTMGAGAMVLGNTIHVDPTDPRWAIRAGTTLPEDPHDESWDSFNGVLLAHEPAHVWSYQHQGTAYAINSVLDQLQAMQGGARGGAYLYKPDRAYFLEYGEEQRAMIVQDFVAAVRARRKGEPTSLTIYGGSRPVDEVIHTLGKYIDQMRSAGPGVAQPGSRQPEWILCACVTRGFQQDGLAGLVGKQGDALVAGIGRAATQAVVDGVLKKDVLLTSAGLAGVGAAVAASLVGREQMDNGAASGGSAILDQAGIPRGVAIGKDGVVVSTKAAWDAPLAGVGVGDPRVEWGASVHRDFDQTRVDGTANAVIARSGEVREAELTLRVEQGDAAIAGNVGVVPQRGADPARTWAHVMLVTAPVTLSASGQVTSRDGVVQRLTAQSGVDVAQGSISTEARFARAASDAPLALDEATLRASVAPSAGTSMGVQAKLVPAGLDELSAQVATMGDAGSLALTAAGTKLTTSPTVGVSLTATERKSGVAVSANAQATPSTGAVQGGVSVSIPLDPVKKT